MTTITPTPSVSSGGSPEIDHYQNVTAVDPIYSHHTYHHIPGHAQAISNTEPYGSIVVTKGGGAHCPSRITVSGGQYSPSISAPNAGFIPAYSGAALTEHHPYYYYQWLNGNWAAIQTSLHLYAPHGYTTSPPSTPPQPQVPYGYPMVATGYQFHQPSPGTSYHNHGHQPQVPSLDHRRGSCSSSGATDTPSTPFSTNVDPVPTIVGEQQGIIEDHKNRAICNHVESLLLSGPPLPQPISPIFAPGVASLAQTLDNPTNTTNVYIRGLPPDTNDDKLYEMTCRFGTVVSHKAIIDTEHGTCKGCVDSSLVNFYVTKG